MSIYFTLILCFFVQISIKTGRVLITLYALKLGAQPFAVGFLAANLSVLPTLLSWHVGRLSDRFGSRWLILFGNAAGILGMLTPYFVPGLATLFVTSVMYGLLAALSVPPLQNLVGLQSGPHDSARNFSNYSLAVTITEFAGPVLAGFSIDHVAPENACLILVVLLLAPAAMLLARGAKLPGATGAAKSAGNIGTLLSEPGLWRVLATSSLVVTGIELFQVFIPIYGHGIGFSASAIGILLAVYASAAFVVRFFLPFLIKQLSVERVLAYSFLIGAMAFVWVPFLKSFEVLCLVSLFFGLGMGCGQPVTVIMAFGTSTQGRSGEAMGLRITVTHLTRVITQVFFGTIGSVFGVFSVFWVNAVMLASGWAVSHPGVVGRWRKES